MKIKRYRIVLMLVLGLSLTLTACKKSASTNVTTDKSTDEIVDDLLASQSKFSNHERLEKGSIEYDDYLELKYDMLSYEPMLEGCVVDSLEATADEFAVFHILSDKSSTDEKAPTASEVKEKLESFILDRKAVFNGYAPLEIAKLDKAEISVYGDYVILMICDDVDAASDAAASCFNGASVTKKVSDNTAVTATPEATAEPTSVPTEEPAATPSAEPSPTNEPIAVTTPQADNTTLGGFVITDELKAIAPSMYDNSKIVEAYKSGDSSQLTDEKQLAVLQAAQAVISEVITDGMTDFDMECAIHDYMVKWADYDSVAMANHSTMSPEADNPYGFLINKYGICSGYTTTFQLFMDMLDIPCLSIKANSGSVGHLEDHAWNMALIDNKWYYVDVTWDDPVGGMFPNSTFVAHTFFNTTNKMMESTGHFWNSDLYPKVTESRSK